MAKKLKIEPGSLEEFLGPDISRYSESQLSIMKAGWFIGSNHGIFTKKMPTEDELYCLKWSYEMGCKKAMDRHGLAASAEIVRGSSQIYKLERNPS